MSALAKPIVFLDRDGTINVDYGYVFDPERLELIPGAAQALAKLKRAGFVLVVISNQSAIARGYCKAEDVDQTNQRLAELLLAEDPDAVLDWILYSPDGADQGSTTRKPEIGLLEELRPHCPIDPMICWMVGDKISDLEFAKNAGIPGEQRILVQTGKGAEEAPQAQKRG